VKSMPRVETREQLLHVGSDVEALAPDFLGRTGAGDREPAIS
jgi:hypothetical protein